MCPPTLGPVCKKRPPAPGPVCSKQPLALGSKLHEWTADLSPVALRNCPWLGPVRLKLSLVLGPVCQKQPPAPCPLPQKVASGAGLSASEVTAGSRPGSAPG
ncbi:hypothetical protein NDU88_007011 [Pleurodeles waltl]|uniref:Uncharacterized protein n=1 Tax=Pleurodeles waltl TaxID=8319 RepID=A0AAV7MFL7_PLEWA|nr:hypothetical protein NDU88_007011 [Pleurodeles waltl]